MKNNTNTTDTFENTLNCSLDALKELCDLPYNWDDEGANPVKEMAYIHSVDMVSYIYNSLYNDMGVILPNVSAGLLRSGSVDIHIQNDKFQILINVDYIYQNFKIVYYGEGVDTVSINESTNKLFDERIVEWIKQQYANK